MAKKPTTKKTNKTAKTCPSGLVPIEFKVLILPDARYTNKQVASDGMQYDKSEGGILIPQGVSEREQGGHATGTLVALGGRAFEDFGDPCPKIGDKVSFGRYAGQMQEGADGLEYRVCMDKDINLIVLS